MNIGRTFEEATQKAIKAIDFGFMGFDQVSNFITH